MYFHSKHAFVAFLVFTGALLCFAFMLGTLF